MKKFAIVITLTILSGCSIFPETKEELSRSGSHSPDYCLNYDRALVESRVESYLSKCFKPNYVDIGNGTGFVNGQQLIKEKSIEKTEFSIYSPSGTGAGYFLNVVISNNNSNCKTNMSATAYNFMWKQQFEKLNESIKGGDPWCSF